MSDLGDQIRRTLEGQSFPTLGVAVTCWKCHDTFHVPIPDAAYDAWKAGAFIQVAWPQGSADERELLISQTCGKCWDEMWEDEE